LPALALELRSKGAQAYLALAGEMMRRMEARGIPTHAMPPASPPTVPPAPAPAL